MVRDMAVRIARRAPAPDHRTGGDWRERTNHRIDRIGRRRALRGEPGRGEGAGQRRADRRRGARSREGRAPISRDRGRAPSRRGRDAAQRRTSAGRRDRAGARSARLRRLAPGLDRAWREAPAHRTATGAAAIPARRMKNV
ncbi:hypothetical protein C6V07_35410 [Burkholderia gladioli]|nr:hypothetical protein C6V07_35410 [Burkholderia gladioli]